MYFVLYSRSITANFEEMATFFLLLRILMDTNNILLVHVRHAKIKIYFVKNKRITKINLSLITMCIINLLLFIFIFSSLSEVKISILRYCHSG